MRFEGDGDEHFPGQWALWEHNLERNMSGKAGQAKLRELRDALRALPEKRLIETRLADSAGNVCALGALAVQRRVAAGEQRQAVLEEVATQVVEDEWGLDCWEAEQTTLAEARACGVKTPMAVAVAYENDFGPREETPEQRYTRVLAWVEKRIIEEAA